MRSTDLPALRVGADLWLVTGSTPATSDWLELVAERHPRIVRCATRQGETLLLPLMAAVATLAPDVGDGGAAYLLLDMMPNLLSVADLVNAISFNPWHIRHPRDLATVSNLPRREVRARCWELGFTRVEHFVTFVRLSLLLVLANRRGVPPTDARSQVGIADLSNFRRQLRRASSGSPEPFRALNATPVENQ